MPDQPIQSPREYLAQQWPLRQSRKQLVLLLLPRCRARFPDLAEPRLRRGIQSVIRRGFRMYPDFGDRLMWMVAALSYLSSIEPVAYPPGEFSLNPRAAAAVLRNYLRSEVEFLYNARTNPFEPLEKPPLELPETTLSRAALENIFVDPAIKRWLN